MKNKQKIILFLVVIAVSILLTLLTAPKKGSAKASVIDLVGKKTTLSSEIVKDQAVILDFFTTWCPHCITSLPELRSLYKEGYQIIGIDIGEKREKVQMFVNYHEIPYKVLIDSRRKLAAEYKVRGVPTYILINKEGRQVYQGHSLDALKEHL
jgi:thiol-disulfide isomerase/thioredoxin